MSWGHAAGLQPVLALASRPEPAHVLQIFAKALALTHLVIQGSLVLVKIFG